MNETGWLANNYPGNMLEYVREKHSEYLNDRRLRLFACTCARLMGRVDSDEQLENAEAFADGKVDVLRSVRYSTGVPGIEWCYEPSALRAAFRWAGSATIASSCQKAAVFRDIIHNPWQRLPTRSGTKLYTLNYVECVANLTPMVLGLAEAIYQDRLWDQTPILADALEEAGCTHTEMLEHLRDREKCPDPKCSKYPLPAKSGHIGQSCNGTGWIQLRSPHVRGCWALDLIRGVQ